MLGILPDPGVVAMTITDLAWSFWSRGEGRCLNVDCVVHLVL